MRVPSLRYRRVRWMPVMLLAACASAPSRAPRGTKARDVPPDVDRDYAIWLGGARVGTAHETERWSPAGVILQRTEAMRFLRGSVPVAIATVIEITADPSLAPSRVSWTERAQTTRHAEAQRDATGWILVDDTGQLGAIRLPAAAIPAELAPLFVRRDGRFAGPVFLPARGFAAGDGRIEPIAPRRLIAQLAVNTVGTAPAPGAANAAPRAIAEATIDLGDDAMPIRVVDGEGVIATRITASDAAIAFRPVDLLAATSIPLTGSPSETSPAKLSASTEAGTARPLRASTLGAAGRAGRPSDESHGAAASPRIVRSSDESHGAVADPRAGRSPGEASSALLGSRGATAGSSSAHVRRIVLDGDLPVPSLPGQAPQVTPDGMELALSPQLAGGLPPGPPGTDRTREIITLVANVHRRIAPDLAAAPSSARSATAATAGDCTTFALAYAALASTRGIPTRIITGFRIDGDRLVRHRWAISWAGGAWIAIDAAFGAVPAGGDLIGLAVHTADDVGLLAGEAALTHVRAARWK